MFLLVFDITLKSILKGILSNPCYLSSSVSFSQCKLLFVEKIQLYARWACVGRTRSSIWLEKGWDGIKRGEKRNRAACAQPPEIFNRSGIHYFRESRARCFSFLSAPCREFDTRRPMSSAPVSKKRINEKKKRDKQKERGRRRGREMYQDRTDDPESLSNRNKLCMHHERDARVKLMQARGTYFNFSI